MRYLTGTEISVTFAGETVHIVGLGFDPDDAGMRHGLLETRGGRGERAREIAAGNLDVRVPTRSGRGELHARRQTAMRRTMALRLVV